MAQKHFKQGGTGNQLRNPSLAGNRQAWDLAFENGDTGGFKKTHSH